MESAKKSLKNGINLSKIFSDTTILDPIKDEKVIFREVWEKNEKPLMLIHWLRRFG
jgi:hypothetical protein